MVRPGRESDVPFILTLVEREFLAYGSYDEYVRDWLRNESISVHVAEIDGRPAGFFLLATYADSERPSDHVADLVAIAVEPELQSRGVGSLLLEHALELARNAEPPVCEIGLVVAEGNARAQRLFSRHGFRLRRGVGIYPAGQRALKMVKPLE